MTFTGGSGCIQRVVVGSYTTMPTPFSLPVVQRFVPYAYRQRGRYGTSSATTSGAHRHLTFNQHCLQFCPPPYHSVLAFSDGGRGSVPAHCAWFGAPGTAFSLPTAAYYDACSGDACWVGLFLPTPDNACCADVGRANCNPACWCFRRVRLAAARRHLTPSYVAIERSSYGTYHPSLDATSVLFDW